MDSAECKKHIVGAISHYFDGLLQLAKRAGGANGKVPGLIEKTKSSFINVASSVEARIYTDHELSDSLLKAGVDLAYRSVIMSDVARDDEWVAVLAVGLDELDDDSRKAALSYLSVTDIESSSSQRLLAFITCAKRLITLNPRFVIASELNNSLALSPCILEWGIRQSDGRTAVVGHVPKNELGDEFLNWASQMLSVLDSSHAARSFNDHMREVSLGTMH